MAMPHDLVLVRHGEAEGNVVRERARGGDESGYTERFVTTPGRRWQLTREGREQARCAGRWIAAEFPSGFDRYYASPFTRTKQTVSELRLPLPATDGADGDRAGSARPQWYLNRGLRERDWGDIGSIPRRDFAGRPEYALNAARQRNDPLYWVPPGGESIAQVAENRVRNFLDTLHRELDGRRVIAVTHGEFIWAVRLVLERFDDDEYARLVEDDDERLDHGEILHYTRRDPQTGAISERLEWLRRSRPVRDAAAGTGSGSGWTMRVGNWQPISYGFYLGDTLADEPEGSE